MVLCAPLSYRYRFFSRREAAFSGSCGAPEGGAESVVVVAVAWWWWWWWWRASAWTRSVLGTVCSPEPGGLLPSFLPSVHPFAPPPRPLADASSEPQGPRASPLSRPASFVLQGLVRVRPPSGGLGKEGARGVSPTAAFVLPPLLPPHLYHRGYGFSKRRSRCRVVWSNGARHRGCRVAAGGGRPLSPFLLASLWPRSVLPDPVRVPGYRVPARRFKDPGGVALPSPWVWGGGGACGEPARWRLPRTPVPSADEAVPGCLAAVWAREPPLGARGTRPSSPGLPGASVALGPVFFFSSRPDRPS